MQKRDLIVVDLELEAAVKRRHIHTDPLSRRGNEMTIDSLLEERWALAPREKVDENDQG